ncbi:MAG: GIY-YIG nuclease family protein [Alphaproteobacteria bacterium]|nr:GIY-YIG nuclease family protein [Alphaproteobacteria bacterium]
MRDDHSYFVYILASQRNCTLYTGVTSNLIRRVWEHKEGIVEGFTKTNDVKRLVYYEMFGDVTAAIVREKQLKRWRRSWKLELIEEANPTWADLYDMDTGFVADMPGTRFKN